MLSAFTVHVLPLRQRRDEISLLLGHFMNRMAKHDGLPARSIHTNVVELCQQHSWPGNLREFENFAKRYLVMGEESLTFLQSFNLGSLTAVQSSPVRINNRKDTGGWHFLPAVRQSDSNGNLNVSFYSRSSANTALTNVFAALKVAPRTTTPPIKNDAQVTTGSSDWNAVSSIIIPNFGDYTDNYFLGTTLYVAWSDGRLGFPQPFEDHVSVH